MGTPMSVAVIFFTWGSSAVLALTKVALVKLPELIGVDGLLPAYLYRLASAATGSREIKRPTVGSYMVVSFSENVKPIAENRNLTSEKCPPSVSQGSRRFGNQASLERTCRPSGMLPLPPC